MEDKSPQNPLVAISVITVLFAALGVIVYHQVPLKGVRPYTPAIQEPPPKIRARLWQDPFTAVLDHFKDNAEKASITPGALIDLKSRNLKSGYLRKQIEVRLNQGNVTVLGVMVPGGPYDEDIEGRLRYRYAVLSGLHLLEYFPEDAEHIDFTYDPVQPGINLSNIIPFEWCSKPDASVLVIWMSNEASGKKPLHKLASLVGRPHRNSKSKLEIKLIGPYLSSDLLDMYKELDSIPNSLQDLEIYSPTATIPDYYFFPSAAADANSKDILAKEFERFGITFQRTICNDKDLVLALIEELGRRGVGPEDHIALIGEWETSYGRYFRNIFKALSESTCDDKNPCANDLKKSPKVLLYSYLRGIDGKIPGEEEKKAKQREKKNGDTKEDKEELDTAKLEAPTGKSQYDYLRRLAARIHRKDLELKREGEGPIKAIGVVGIDFCDKFLVLQALGQWFPERIFFTTDLDARLLQPSNIEWTRNLIVASAYGLELCEDLQGDMPPFRGSYQTSIFLATLRAFNYKEMACNKDLPPKPRIYEIGRKKVFVLTSKPDNPDDVAMGVNPPIKIPENGARWWLIFASLVLALVFILLLSQSVRKYWFFIPVAIFVLGGIGLAFLFLIHRNLAQEPFSWTGGVSIWPTEIIRLLALGLSWVFILRSRSLLRSNCNAMKDEFNLTSCAKMPGKELVYCFRSELRVQDGEIKTNAKKIKVIKVNDVWRAYIRNAGWGSRLWFVFFLTVIYFLACVIFMGISDFPTETLGLSWKQIVQGFPSAPVRGNASWLWDKFTLLLTVLSFLFLTFSVLDANVRCCRFIRKFLGKEPQWNEESLELFDPEGTRQEEELSYRMLLRLVAKRTAVVGKLIFYPFIVWVVLFTSRNHYFDNWRTRWDLAIVISLIALLAWICALWLRRSIERLRRDIMNRLDQELIGAQARESLDEKQKKRVDRLKELLKEVTEYRQGAFASYLQNPVIQTLLVPLGGVGSITLLELLGR